MPFVFLSRKITGDKIASMVISMPERVAAVRAVFGGHTALDLSVSAFAFSFSSLFLVISLAK